jgi:hypothetical protein
VFKPWAGHCLAWQAQQHVLPAATAAAAAANNAGTHGLGKMQLTNLRMFTGDSSYYLSLHQRSGADTYATPLATVVNKHWKNNTALLYTCRKAACTQLLVAHLEQCEALLCKCRQVRITRRKQLRQPEQQRLFSR